MTTTTETTPDLSVASLLATRKVIVCCGAGGVGKTTTSAALALAAARAGRRVLVLTIDPSRRLAETLGVSRNPPKPVPLPEERRVAAGIEPPGSLEAWMLDPQLVSDEAVRRLVKDEAQVKRLLENKVYQRVTAMVAGMHEYTAMEALHRFVEEGRYDLVILDTPPSRHALDFLEAPTRLSRFIDGKIFRLFIPKEGGLIRGAASKLIARVLATVFGAEFAEDLTTFFKFFGGVFASLSGDVNAMRHFLSRQDVSFLLVTTPAESALKEALYFQVQTRELGLPFSGFILNRCFGAGEPLAFPDDDLLPEGASEAARSGLEKLRVLAREEQRLAERDRGLAGELAARQAGRGVTVSLPSLPQGADDMRTLLAVADRLAAS